MAYDVMQVFKSFGDKAVLKGFSHSFEKGKLYLLTGDSGIGKTTLLHIMMGLIEADSGEIPKGLQYSAVFQENRLLLRRSAVENLRPAVSKGLTENEIREKLRELLPEDALDKPAEELSGGMQRRLSIARAMLNDSDIVIMDEPFTGLDGDNILNTLDFILRHQAGRTLIIATHRKEILEPYDPELITLK